MGKPRARPSPTRSCERTYQVHRLLASGRVQTVAAVVSGSFSHEAAALKLLLAAFGGVAVGLLVGVLVARVRRLVGQAPTVEATISLLTPFFAYLPAERLGASGILAVVAVGAYLGWRGPRIISAQS